MNWKWIFVLILLSFLVIFTAQNYEVVEVQFFFWSFSTSRAIIIFSSLLIGILIGIIISYIKQKQS